MSDSRKSQASSQESIENKLKIFENNSKPV